MATTRTKEEKKSTTQQQQNVKRIFSRDDKRRQTPFPMQPTALKR